MQWNAINKFQLMQWNYAMAEIRSILNLAIIHIMLNHNK